MGTPNGESANDQCLGLRAHRVGEIDNLRAVIIGLIYKADRKPLFFSWDFPGNLGDLRVRSLLPLYDEIE
jgi:hypothetical protein